MFTVLTSLAVNDKHPVLQLVDTLRASDKKPYDHLETFLEVLRNPACPDDKKRIAHHKVVSEVSLKWQRLKKLQQASASFIEYAKKSFQSEAEREAAEAVEGSHLPVLGRIDNELKPYLQYLESIRRLKAGIIRLGDNEAPVKSELPDSAPGPDLGGGTSRSGRGNSLGAGMRSTSGTLSFPPKPRPASIPSTAVSGPKGKVDTDGTQDDGKEDSEMQEQLRDEQKFGKSASDTVEAQSKEIDMNDITNELPGDESMQAGRKTGPFVED